MTGGPGGPCFESLEVFAPEQIKRLDSVPREARRASWALFLSPAAVLVPGGQPSPLGGRFCVHPVLFLVIRLR